MVPSTWLALTAVAAAMAGCGGEPRQTSDRRPAPTASPSFEAPAEAALKRPSVARLLRRCDVTEPNHNIPPGQDDNPGAAEADYHGDGELWTVLPPRGVLVAGPNEIRRDGAIDRKFPWWRAVRGQLRITGSRLDFPGPPLRASIPSGYGPTGFQASAIIFRTEGCWQVTARAGRARLTFVTLVVKAPADP